METTLESVGKLVLLEPSEKMVPKVPKFRDTVLVRASRVLRDEIGRFAKEKPTTISKLVDQALEEFILSLKRQSLN